MKKFGPLSSLATIMISAKLCRDGSISSHRTCGRMGPRGDRRTVIQVHVVKLYNHSGDSNMITASDAKTGAWKENI